MHLLARNLKDEVEQFSQVERRVQQACGFEQQRELGDLLLLLLGGEHVRNLDAAHLSVGAPPGGEVWAESGAAVSGKQTDQPIGTLQRITGDVGQAGLMRELLILRAE